MIRLGLLILLAAATTGCTTSRKVVVQEGYRGITQTPAGFEPPVAQPLTPEPAPRP